MNKFLCGNALWLELAQWSKRCRERRLVATPYLGDGATQLNLGGLQRGDALICAFTKGNVEAGVVSPNEIEKLMDAGVRVFTQEDLHAKVFLFDSVAAVGSANLTRHSLDVLDEACVLTDDRQVVNSIRTWFSQRMSCPISRGLLESLKPLFRTSQASSAERIKDRENLMEDTAPQDGLTLWIAPVVSIRFPSDENSQREKGERSAAERLNERTVFSVETLRWTWNVPFERDNILVEVLYEENEWYIQPHARVLEKVKVKGKSEVFYIYVERQEGAVPMAWDAFREMCSRADLTLEPDPKDMDPVCVTKSHQKIRVLDLTAPKGP